MGEDFSVPVLLLIVIAIGTVVFVIYSQSTNKKYPPYTPSKISANLRQDGYQRVRHLYEQSLWTNENIKQDISTGCVYRLRVPLWYGLTICCDYKLAKLLLSGSDEHSIPESEKTSLIQLLNLFDNVCSLLTYAHSLIFSLKPSSSLDIKLAIQIAQKKRNFLHQLSQPTIYKKQPLIFSTIVFNQLFLNSQRVHKTRKLLMSKM
jgi:hypothetical protein